MTRRADRSGHLRPVEVIAHRGARAFAPENTIDVWTENDSDRMRALCGIGVTGIFTDYPNRLRAVLDSLRQE